MVFMPDFFEGSPADLEWYPPDTEEKGAKLGEWFKTAAPPKHLPKVPGIVKAAQEYNENIKTWGIIGYCWVRLRLSVEDDLNANLNVRAGR